MYKAPKDHLFFVYGHGWSSIIPGKRAKQYNIITCRRLEVGDICLVISNKTMYSNKRSKQIIESQNLSNEQHCKVKKSKHFDISNKNNLDFGNLFSNELKIKSNFLFNKQIANK